MKDPDCIFCKIAAGEIPSNKVYETDNVLVFLDAFPAQEGHCLVIPKEHARDLLDLPEETATEVLPVAKKVMQAMEKILKPHGYSIIQNNREQAGQEVFHYHLHIVPRYKGRGPRGSRHALTPDNYEYKPGKADLQEIARKIGSAVL